MLTPEQQKLIEQNLDVAQRAVRDFRRRLPYIVQYMDIMDVESAAYEGICLGARTYDPDVSTNARGYLYLAARNAILRDLKKEIRRGGGKLTKHGSPKVENLKSEEKSRALECLYSEMEEMERDWLEHYSLNRSRRAIKRELSEGTGHRQIKQKLDEMIEKFKQAYDDFTD